MGLGANCVGVGVSFRVFRLRWFFVDRMVTLYATYKEPRVVIKVSL